MKILNKFVIPLVAKNWYALGLELLDSKYETSLEIFQENYRQDVELCCRETFKKWLETKADSTSWDHLITALENIDMHKVAKNVKEILQQSILGESIIITITANAYS